MDIEEIRAARLAHPFRPFSLVLEDGRELPVERAGTLTISPTRRFVTHSSPARLESIVVERIRSLKFLAEAAGVVDTTGTEGQK
jgi:hypothetical protein